jgi:hypothetical protein
MSTIDPSTLGGEFITNPLPVVKEILERAQADLDALGAGVLDVALAANIETIIATGPTDPAKLLSNLDSTAGVMTITPSVPGAANVGRFKQITLTVDGGNVTMTMTNIVGQPTGTTFTLDDVGDSMFLYAISATKYLYLGGNPTIV